MGFPIITPSFLNELKETLKPVSPDEFCDVNITASAVEYVPQLFRPETVRKLIEEKDILSYNMINLPDSDSERFEEQSRLITETYPQTKYYWQIRTLFMSIIQNRQVNFEKRFLLLNYALKTVQGMLNGGQGELIPGFVDSYTAEGADYKTVLEYFKDIRPNPGYSLADGVSLLKSLAKPNAACKEVMNGIYKNIGVSGPETLKMADMKKYTELRKAYSLWAEGEKSRYVENVMINYIWYYSIPFSEPRFNIWDHFVFFCSLYNALKVMLTCYYLPDGSDECFVKAVTSFDAALRTSDKDLMGKVIMAVKQAGQNNNGDLAVLTLS